MLFGSTALEVAIGMLFVYLVLSMLCSAISEYIEAKLNNRAKDLEKGIRLLLNDPDKQGLARDLYEHPLVKGLHRAGNLPSYIPSRTFALALWNMATKYAESTKSAGVTMDINTIKGAVAKLPNEDVRTALLTLIDEAGGDLDRARQNIEDWYDAAMDRASGWYKRRVQVFLLIIGFVVAAAINADSINIGRALTQDSVLRSSIVSSAEAAARTPPAADANQTPEAKIEDVRKQLRGLGLPLGWDFGKDFHADPRGVPHALNRETFGWSLLKLTGLILTAFAVSQGAPFWFDILNKFIVIRSTVKPSEKSREQPSKDKPAPRTEIDRKGGEKENTGE